MKRTIAALICIVGLLAGCATQDHPELFTCPTGYIEAGTTTAHDAWKVKRALSKAGIPAYADASDYPLPYRILVPAEMSAKASRIIEETKFFRTK
jgi:hypothetical protein